MTPPRAPAPLALCLCLGLGLTSALVCVCGCVCGCGRRSPAGVSVLDPPAPAGSRFPHLDAGADGALYLNWIDVRDGAPTEIGLATFDGRRWSDPRTVGSDVGMSVNWADFPAVAATPRGELAAAWLVRHGSDPYAFDAWLARSTDGGATWSGRLRAHDDAEAAERGFVTLAPETDGSIGVVWLDGRARAQEGAGEAMQLMYRRWSGRTLGPETVLDPDVCTCCQTAAASDGADLFVAYRDHRPGSMRDIGLARRIDGRWLTPQLVHEDGWHIAGCPINGPAIGASRGRLAVAWFTAADERPRVLVAFSTDRGATFGAPVQVDGGQAVGRVDLLLDDAGAAWVSWVECSGGSCDVLLRRVRPDGTADAARNVGVADPGRPSGFPRMARVGSRIYVAWTAGGPPSRVRVVAVDTPAGARPS